MIIHPVTTRTVDGEMIVSAQIEPTRGAPCAERRLWFRFPESVSGFISDRADSLLVSLLFAAMASGQDLDVRGCVSPKLLEGIGEMQKTLVRRFPETLKQVAIRAECVCSTAQDNCPQALVSAFSGGVDSFYTLQAHRAENESEPTHVITHGLFAHGFDIPLNDERTFAVCRDAYAKLFARMGLDLLTVRTNARWWYGNLDWTWMHVGPLVGAALALQRGLRRFYIPASFMVQEPFPLDVFAHINSLFSTETCEIADVGGEVSRVERTLAIAHMQEAFSHLRVCWVKPNGLENCCRCRKCMMTMTALELAGTLSEFTTFPLPFTRRQLRAMDIPYSYRVGARRLIRRAQAAGRSDMAFDLSVALARSSVRWVGVPIGRAGLRFMRRYAK